MTLEQNKKTAANWDYKYVEVQNKDEELDKSDPKPNYTQEFISTLIVGLVMINSGINFTWIGPILPQLLSGNFKIQITMEQSVWIIGLVNIGAIPGCLVASMVSNKYGRKKAIIMSAIPFIISALIDIFAESVLHYYIARFMGGYGIGVSFAVVPMYISEISSPNIRGILSVSIYMAMSMGTLFVFVFGAYLPIVTYCAVLTIFPIIQLVFTFYLSETPYFHMIKNNYNEAENALKFLRKKSNVQDELNRLIEGYKDQTAEGKPSVWDLFTDSTNLKSVFIVTVLLMGQMWTGARAIFEYSQVLFEDGHSSISAEKCGIIVAVMNFAVIFLSGWLVDRFGRRKLIMASGIITFLPLAVLGGYFYLQDYTNFEHMEKLRLIPLIGIVFFKFSFGIGLHGMAYVLTGELFPTSVKAYATSVISIIGSAIAVAANKMYQVVLTKFDYPGVFVMFIMWLILVLIFAYFVVPETKGLTLEEIQVKLRKLNKK
ncbi:facilitated trehalose transporter Tret1-like [Chrysoperla carnea]|uniref:facilitated trehalose transporter Tret1-like n=1 Tax=Chrysoperla carnea TaxID=189513 RepID=UPI001D098F55|nr:facilitated trehalose transporter Tret1-like [Chrysoperla carnea]